MIKLVAFDLDGTIGDTIPMCIKAFRLAVSPYAGHLLTDRKIAANAEELKSINANYIFETVRELKNYLL